MHKAFAWVSMLLTLGFTGAAMTALFMNASMPQWGYQTLLGVTMPLVVWGGLGLLALAVLLAVVILLTAGIG